MIQWDYFTAFSGKICSIVTLHPILYVENAFLFNNYYNFIAYTDEACSHSSEAISPQ